MDALLRRRAMMAAGAIPAWLPYIRGGADGSYIDTGITPDNTTRVIVWARNWNPGTANNMLFGYMDNGSNSNGFALSTWATASTGRIGVYFGDYTNPYTILNDAWPYLGGYHKYELDGKILKIDDVVKVTSGSTATISTNGTIHLFGRNTGGTHTATALPIDICACKIYKNGTLVRDFTAVNSPSVGLYDAVSDTVFTNAGTGSFTYGTFNPNAYTPLPYVGLTGAQYFNTGILGTYSLPIVMRFRPTSTTQKSRWIAGARTSVSSKRCDFQVSADEQPANKNFIFFYQSAANNVYTSSSKTGIDLVWVKNNNTSTLYEGNTQLGTATGATGNAFSTDYPIVIGTFNNAGTIVTTTFFEGYIYYIGFGASANYVPARVNGVVGFYDTYNDSFHPSASATPFVAGA